MHVFRCAEEPNDHIGVAVHPNRVLVVLRETDGSASTVELLLTTNQARALADACTQALHQRRHRRVGPIHVGPSVDDDRVLLTADRGDQWRSVVLDTDDTHAFAAVLATVAADVEAQPSDPDRASPPTTPQPGSRAMALLLALEIVGRDADCSRVMTAARWIAGEVD
ncbi:hypothetical protein JOD54_001083 [Actinokineospora baliensis]|uniref:hypothetical protein n=1 Tax=Actinokineospora baliensis TaxID=547056 RepID=UPI00195DB088|nr:hypothetical protein [Actinokineospora baliensis]MBM7770879.1 hypothetical protein [Actinokineospora baliensis]